MVPACVVVGNEISSATNLAYEIGEKGSGERKASETLPAFAPA